MSRNISELHPELQKKIALLKQECSKQGVQIGISECVRTAAEQDALYAKGRTYPGRIVTNCRGITYGSMHQWGVAVDFYRNDGKGAYVDTDAFFAKVGKIGQNIGLEWGGSWRNPVDKPHLQLSDWGSTAVRLKAAYVRPDNFMASWKDNIASSAPPTTMDVSKQVIRTVQQWLAEYTKEVLVLDGVYGKNSCRAMVKAVQLSVGVPASGTITDALLNKLLPVHRGGTGNLVKCLEGLLFIHGYNPQEFQGNCTETVAAAVALAQRDKGVAVDGIAGKNTFRVLIG